MKFSPIKFVVTLAVSAVFAGALAVAVPRHSPLLPVPVQPTPIPGNNTLTIDETSNSKTLNLAVGQSITLMLHSTYWHIDGSSSQSVVGENGESTSMPMGSPGIGCIPGGGCGTVQANFTARSAGTATIKASRTVCGEALACRPEQRTFLVSIIVGSQSIPSVDETANWKVYRNEKYEYEIRIPLDWMAYVPGNNYDSSDWRSTLEENTTYFKPSIASDDAGLITSIRGDYGVGRRFIEAISPDTWQIRRVENTSFSGFPAKNVIIYNASAKHEFNKLMIEHNNRLYILDGFSNGTRMNQILYTFRFIN